MHSARSPFWLLLLTLASAAKADALAVMLSEQDFAESYRTWYDALDGFPPEDLRYELTESVEDAMLNGGFLTRANLDHKRRRIENQILAGAHAALCSESTAAATNAPVQRSCTAAALKGLDEAEVNAEPHQVGMIAAVCARLVETPSVAQWCAARP
ncbi:hypothetical protein [Halochromatium glycolicum]|uniref:Secreted protein n=1 Tax=Halochromatium glycolicum TaxID=85075 RepID=A0AAJ0X9E6_9GAMM|nr:hypothetical protein [Halochromatium glycolicum]MBK1704734.1 hypothetical protein [Halochromatium glycolicum]